MPCKTVSVFVYIYVLIEGAGLGGILSFLCSEVRENNRTFLARRIIYNEGLEKI